MVTIIIMAVFINLARFIINSSRAVCIRCKKTKETVAIAAESPENSKESNIGTRTPYQRVKED
jgi:hypothetical protein